MTDIDRDRDRVLENIGLAFVNGHITQAEAEQARAALIAEWRIIDNEQICMQLMPRPNSL